MALADWDAITSITREKILPAVMSQVRLAMPLLDRFLKSAERLDGGTSIDKVIKYVKSTRGNSYAGLGPLNTNQEKTRSRARWPWSQYYFPIVVSNIDVAKNGGTERVVPLVAQEMEEAREDLNDMIGGDLFGDGTGNGALDFLGLVAAVDDGTNVATYGGITRSGNTFWQSYYNGSVGTLDFAKLRTAWDAVAAANTDGPTVIVVRPAGFSLIEDLYTANLRYDVSNAGASPVDLPLKLKFRGADVLADEKVPAGYGFMLNERYFKWYYLNHPKFPTRNDGFAVSDMREPVDQDGQVGFIFSYFQMINLQPRRSGALRGITGG